MDVSADAARIVCIDRSLEDDLLFRQALVRGIERQADRPTIILVVGSGDLAERSLSDLGHEVRREDGILVLGSPEERSQFERAMRESARLYVSLLTDAGVSCVGFFGADRKILSSDSESRLHVSGLKTMVALGRSGVVSVLTASAVDFAQNLIDLHPIQVCHAIYKTLEEESYNIKGDITLISRNMPEALPRYADNNVSTTWSNVVASGLHFDDQIVLFAAEAQTPFFISTAANVGGISRIRVGV